MVSLKSSLSKVKTVGHYVCGHIKSWVRGTTILTPPPPPPFKYEILNILISLLSIFIEN